MSDVIGFHGVPAPRRFLARQLREMAAILETDQAETEPNGIMMVLMGAHQFEVVGIGDTEGWAGARNAMSAVLGARFDTVGGNIRTRGHAIYQPRPMADMVPLTISAKNKPA